MAKYSDIKGFTVQTLASDTAASQFAGGSWASGGTAPTALYSVVGFGTQTAALAGGGYSGTAYTNNTFEYDGSSWTSGGSLTASAGQAREGHGVLTAGGAVAGYKESGNAVIANYETYDGTSFTEQNDLNTARQDVAATGSTTAALAVGGTSSVGPGSTQEGLTNVESYNGSSWTETTENNTGRVRAVSFPGAPAPTMIFVGGSSDSTLYANVETYNGSAWTEITDLNTARSALAGAGQAQTDGIVFGGSAPSATAATEQWNGTSWTELADLSTARNTLAGAGTGAASALAAMGYSTAASALTEEFTAPSVFSQITKGQLFFNSTTNAFKETVSNIPPTTWSSGGNLNTARWNASGSTRGSQTSSIIFGGNQPVGPNAITAKTEKYDGSSWTEVNDLNTGRGVMGGGGTATAAICVGGYTGTARVGNTETWNGTSWTEVNDLNQARSGLESFGIQTSALATGGNVPPSTVYSIAETWDGTSWTEVSDLNEGRYQMASVGSSNTEGFVTGGESSLGTPAIRAYTEKWNGSSWTEVNDLNTARYSWSGGAGEVTSGLVFGGYTGTAASANTELFNGTSWTELNDLAEAVYDNAQMGSAFAALKVGGNDGSGVTTTEEWTAPLVNKTITST